MQQLKDYIYSKTQFKYLLNSIQKYSLNMRYLS